MNADPVIAWLEEIRDFAGATDRAREMAQRAIDRLESPPASRPTAADKIERIVDAAREETERGRRERWQL